MSTEPITVDEARRLVGEAERRLAPLEVDWRHSEWNLAARASEEHRQAAESAGIAYETALADPSLHDSAAAAEAAADGDETLRRSAEVLRLATAGKRRPRELIERIVRLETELAGIYSEHRAEVDGRRLSANEINDVLASSTDERLRRAVWEASKGVGGEVDPRLRELVRLRNDAARRLGHRDHYAMSLADEEIDEGWLYGVLDGLEEGLREPWARERAAIDADLRARLGLAADARVEAWHLSDPFGQEPASPLEDPLRDMEAELDTEPAVRRYFADLGHDVDAVMARSDLYPREGKDQHAFQLSMDRGEDVRVLLNVAPTLYWVEVLLHELGHAVYDLSIDPGLPWLLRTPSHTFTTEAVAMLHGRRHRDPVFLGRYLGVPKEVATHPANAVVARRRLLVMAQWVQVMARFERALYADPDGDLGALWWDLVERYQQTPRPPGPRPHDWATKLHLALAPVYYHNYLLGEITASQLESAIARETGNPSPAHAPERAGELLRRRFLEPGRRLRWDALVESATGSPLSTEDFVRQVS